MKRVFLKILACVVVSCGALPSSRAGGVPRAETPERRDARMQWFRDAHFGVMICFGLYSQYGGVWKGKIRKTNNCAEWMMLAARAPRLEYAKAAETFNPAGFDADAWIRAVKGAGAKYIVITAKHHEGFAIFHSRASKYNIVDATPFKRDVLAEVAAACRRHGVRFGVYYSQNLDWYHPGGGSGGWDPSHKGDPAAYVENISIPQIREIMTGYGKVDVLWYDIPGGVVSAANAKRIDAMVHEMRPDIIVNNRLHPAVPSDIQTPEQFIPATGIQGADWETCMTMNRSWGFAADDDHWKDFRTILHMLCDVTSKGGNYLLNIGPDGNGVIPRPSLDRLARVGEWLKVNGEAIYGTRASLFPQQPSWGRFTTRSGKDCSTIYALVFDPPEDGALLLPGLESKILSARVIGSGAALKAGTSPEGIPCVTLDAESRAGKDFAVAVRVEGPARVSKIAYTDGDGKVDFHPHAAVCTRGMRMNAVSIAGLGGPRESLGFWSDPKATATWKFRTVRAGDYALSLTLGAPDSSVGTVIEAVIDGTAHPVAVESTGGWTRYKTFPAGVFRLAAGEHSFVLRIRTLKGQGACNVAPCRLAKTK